MIRDSFFYHTEHQPEVESVEVFKEYVKNWEMIDTLRAMDASN